MRNFTAVAFSWDATYLFAGSSSSDFTAVHVKHKVMHSTTVCGSNGVTSIVAKRTREGDRLILGCGDGLITVLEGTRNGAQTCRTYDKGPADRCAVMLDGKVSASNWDMIRQALEGPLIDGTPITGSRPSMFYTAQKL